MHYLKQYHIRRSAIEIDNNFVFEGVQLKLTTILYVGERWSSNILYLVYIYIYSNILYLEISVTD